jgi:ferrous iron transport protein B
MEVPLILALNMMDEAEAKKYRIDVNKLSKEMGVPVVPMVASRNKGVDELLGEIVRVAGGKEEAGGVRIEYGREVENQISKLEETLSGDTLSVKYSPRWLAIKLLEGDAEIVKKFEGVSHVG